MEGFFIETTKTGRRAVAVRVLNETPSGVRVQVLADCLSPARRKLRAGENCFIPRPYLRMADHAGGERAGDQTIVAVTLQAQPGGAGGAQPVKRTLPGVVMSHDELVKRLGRKSYTLETIEG